MVKSAISVLFSILHDTTSYLPPGLFLALPTAFIEGGKHVSTFRAEFVGTLLMIACTFSAGKWIGKDSLEVAWTSHFFGVIAADYFGGGPHVNPAVTMSMLTLGKSSYTDAYVRVAAQMGGGLIAFPIYHALATNLEWEPLGGPEFSTDDDSAEIEAFLSESLATFCLCLLIYAVNWEWNFGPAMNPMLATSWDVFAVGNTFEFPSDMNHYFVYWVGPFVAAILASIVYVIYAGGTIFGAKLPIGPIKKTKRD